jgi:hypothetical protein
MSIELQRSSNWVRTQRGPEGLDNMYFFEPGCEYGWKEDDGYVWYRLNCRYWFGDWIETQDKTQWRSYGGRRRAIYIVREDFMTFIKLKWL